MTFNDVVVAVQAGTGLTRDQARDLTHLIIDTMRDAILAGQTVRLEDIGTFKLATYRARQGRNPATGAPIMIPAQEYVSFHGSQELRDDLGELPPV